MDDIRNEELEINLLHLFKVILRKWYWIALSIVVITLIAGLYAYLGLEDEYTTETSMIVQVDSTDSDYTNLMTGQRLVDTYTEIAKSTKVLAEVNSRIPEYDLELSQIASMITVSPVNDTLIVNVSVTGENKYMVMAIANTVTEVVKEQSQDFDGLEEIEVFDFAQIPQIPSGPNRMMYVIVGVLLGSVLGVGVVLAIELLDKNIKTEDDLERYLHLRTLGVIPNYDMEEASK